MKLKPPSFALSIVWVLLVAPISVLFISRLGYTQDKIKLKEVKIAGNIRVEEEGIRLHIKNRLGDLYDPATVEQDVKAIFRMGFFDDVQAELSPDAVLTYSVKEKPYVREVKIQGNSQLARDKIETALGVAQRTILDRSKVSEGVDKVKKLYVEQGYVNAAVDYAVSIEANNQAVVVLDITEGSRLLIKKISFEGNRAFGESDLKGLMTTKEEWVFSFVTNRGVLDRDILTNDMAILSNHYFDHGYIDHKIDEPVILRARDGLEVVVRVDEGDQYRVGKVAVGGDLIKDGKEILKQVKITSGQIFRGSRLRDDIANLSDMYSNKGYAFVQVEPLTKINPTEKNVDVTLLITQGPPVYFNRVLIAGNSKTRDKVVRRELFATEQELFSGAKITQSRNALQRTGYFEDVQLTTKKTDQPDTVDVQVDVKEGPTGTFSIGAGYSSGDGFIFNTSIAEKNLMGRGQGISGNFALGSKRQDYVLNFTEPYLNDSQVSLGLDAFNTKRDFSNFNEKKLGFGVNTSYPLRDAYIPFIKAPKANPSLGSDELASAPALTMWDYMRGGVSYDLTREKIDGVQAGAPVSIQDARGTSVTSSMTPNISYDSRDHFFNTTEGTKSSFSTMFAGLGGDNRFIKSDMSARWYYPLFKDPKWGGSYVLALGGTLGYGLGFGGRTTGHNDLPLFARYFLGGINSIRGYSERSLGPREQSCTTDSTTTPPTNTCKSEVVGGDRAAVLNAELLFPIMEEYGLRGVAFFDMGQAFNGSGFNFGDFRRSVGFGGRWMSPFGPLRVELGFPLNKKPGDDTSVLGFSIGSQP
jgi:outer membrane protein insertion porin family